MDGRFADEMKPLTSEIQDAETLRQLGSASVQIVHDLKNQLNGLKLYATFLRKRMEKSERPADEVETINKLIAGLERAATDMTVLVRLGRPLELNRQPGTDLARLLLDSVEGREIHRSDGAYIGDFDAAQLGEALKNISTRGRAGDAQQVTTPNGIEVHLRREEAHTGNGQEMDGPDASAFAVIEWRGAAQGSDGHDLFSSFAGGTGLRMALAARVIKAHGGEVAQEASTLRARLPLAK